MKRAVVTRPAGEAQRWVSALQRQGWDALALPLIEIEPAVDPLPLRQAHARLAEYDALMFVSAPAVAQFFAEQPWPTVTQDDIADPATAAGQGTLPRCWAPGPATARALLAAGVPADRIDQPDASADNYDSESLWQVVGPQLVPGHQLLIVRGQTESVAVAASPQGNGRDWLANQCRAQGGSVDWCVAYRRRAPVWTEPQRELARCASRDGSVWLLSSSEAIDYLRELLPKGDWSCARALATHPRIAQAAASLGFGDLRISRPALADVLINLESMP